MNATEGYTRVYLLTGRVAHLLSPSTDPSNIAARSLCRLDAWPSYWRGKGSYGEIRQAQDMPTCLTCQRKRVSIENFIDTRGGGV